VSAGRGGRSGRGAGNAMLLPCGHEVALEGSPILIEMSATILDHQRSCSPSSLELGPAPWAEPSPS
jgi:hypothetical protein